MGTRKSRADRLVVYLQWFALLPHDFHPMLANGSMRITDDLVGKTVSSKLESQLLCVVVKP